MANFTLFLPDELKEEMRRHSEIRWSEAIRSVIAAKLEAFHEAEKLAAKSRLTMEDVRRLARKADAASAKHARALLHEARG